MTLVLGIDPGKGGGLVLLDGTRRLRRLWPMPVLLSAKRRHEYDLVGCRELLIAAERESSGDFLTAVLERGQPLPPKMGGSAANFQRGYGRGIWEGLLTALGISYQLVAPQRWQRALLAGESAADTKQAALLVARRLWPSESWLRTAAALVPHQGLVDAALIAEWGRRFVAESIPLDSPAADRTLDDMAASTTPSTSAARAPAHVDAAKHPSGRPGRGGRGPGRETR